MSSIKEALEKLYRLSAAVEPSDSSGKFLYEGLDEAVAEIKRIIEEAKPISMPYERDYISISKANIRVDGYHKNLLKALEGQNESN